MTISITNIVTTTLKNLDDYFASAPLKNEICYRCLGSDGVKKGDRPHGRRHLVVALAEAAAAGRRGVFLTQSRRKRLMVAFATGSFGVWENRSRNKFSKAPRLQAAKARGVYLRRPET